jgi:hypothetical protein
MDDQLTPEEIKALVEAGELTKEDLKLLSPQESLMAVDLMTKTAGRDGSAQMEVLGGPVMPPVGGALATVGAMIGVGSGKLPSFKSAWNKAAPMTGGAIGVMTGKAIGHPWAGWNVGHEVGKRLRFKDVGAPPSGSPPKPPSKPPLDARKEGLGRVPRDGGIVEGSGGKPQISVTEGHQPPNLIRENKQDFHASGMSNTPKLPIQGPRGNRRSPMDEMSGSGPEASAAMRTAKFGGLNPESASGNYPAGTGRAPQTAKEWEAVIKQLMSAKTSPASSKATFTEGQEWGISALEALLEQSGGSGADAVPGKGTRRVSRRKPK